MRYRIVMTENGTLVSFIVQRQTTDCRNETHFEDYREFDTMTEAEKYVHGQRRPTRTVVWEGEP
jgi:hypothetical protein